MILMFIDHEDETGKRKGRAKLGSVRIRNTRPEDPEVGHYEVELYGPVRGDGSQRRIGGGTFHAPKKGGQMQAFEVAARGILAALAEGGR